MAPVRLALRRVARSLLCTRQQSPPQKPAAQIPPAPHHHRHCHPEPPTTADAIPQPPLPLPTALSPLESLPVEIQRLILIHSPTFDTLRALVHASPRLHAVYAADRLRILRGFVAQSLGGLLVDAHAAHLSGKDEFQLNREVEMLWEFVEGYQQRRRGSVGEAELVATLGLEELIELARFHRGVVEYLTGRYAVWALAALATSPEAEPLSETERLRVQRGTYRLQVFCNLCGTRGEGRSSPDRIERKVEQARILGLFPAWQVEEMFCIHEFVKDSYGGIFDQVAWDLNEDRNPKYRHIDMCSVSEDLLFFRYTQCYLNKESQDSMGRQGPILLATILKTPGHEERVRLVRQSIESCRGDHGGGSYDQWIDRVYEYDAQYERREGWYSEYDAAQDRGDKTPFEKDTPDEPPFAWVWYWLDEASNLFGWWVPKPFRRWGYVMWDKGRVDRPGVMNFMDMAGRWSAQMDPREDLREELREEMEYGS